MDEEHGDASGTKINPGQRVKKQRVLLILEQTCKKCEGTRSIMHPQWVKFYVDYPDYVSNDSFEGDARFNNRVSKHFGQIIPPHHTTCTNCGGTGNERSEIDLASGLRLIGR